MTRRSSDSDDDTLERLADDADLAEASLRLRSSLFFGRSAGNKARFVLVCAWCALIYRAGDRAFGMPPGALSLVWLVAVLVGGVIASEISWHLIGSRGRDAARAAMRVWPVVLVAAIWLVSGAGGSLHAARRAEGPIEGPHWRILVDGDGNYLELTLDEAEAACVEAGGRLARHRSEEFLGLRPFPEHHEDVWFWSGRGRGERGRPVQVSWPRRYQIEAEEMREGDRAAVLCVV